MPTSWSKRGIVILVLAVLLGGFLRFYDLGGPSFSDDEVYKYNAVQSYREGKWTVTGDDEHPLLLKLLIYTAFSIRDVWNSTVAAGSSVIDLGLESTTRGPNAFVGTLAILMIAFLGRELFSRRVGLLAAVLCAVDIISIGYNRIAKEDTLLAFFVMLSLFLAARAKRFADEGDLKTSRRYEVGCAMAIGGLVASKYFLHMTWVIPLFYFWSRRTETAWKISAKRWLGLVGIAFVTFLVINPTCLSPGNLHYIGKYMKEGTVFTHGYMLFDKLYMNNAFEALKGGNPTPWYYYALYVGVKLSPFLLLAITGGLLIALRKHKQDGPRAILSWLTIWTMVHVILSGAKWGRFTTHLMPPILILAAAGIDSLAKAVVRWSERLKLEIPVGTSLAVLSALVVGPALYAAKESAPHYRMYLNFIGGEPEQVRHYFPHCDLYDVGVREAMFYICARAEQGSQVRTDAPVVSQHYANLCGRPDLKLTTLSLPEDRCLPGRSCYQILQVGRTFFESQPIFEALHAERAPDAVVRARGLNVAEIYGPERPENLAVSIFTSSDAAIAGAAARLMAGRAVRVSALALDGTRRSDTYRKAASLLDLPTDRFSVVEERLPKSVTP